MPENGAVATSTGIGFPSQMWVNVEGHFFFADYEVCMQRRKRNNSFVSQCLELKLKLIMIFTEILKKNIALIESKIRINNTIDQYQIISTRLIWMLRILPLSVTESRGKEIRKVQQRIK